MKRLLASLFCLLLALLLPLSAQAEPYLAMQMGLKCVACHTNPSGGGQRNNFGDTFAQRLMPANQLSDTLANWNGEVIPDRLRIGGDYRWAETDTKVSGQPSQRFKGVEQFRVYGDVQIIKDYLGAYIDEQLSPGKALRQEAYVRLSTPGMGWYAKAGQFYLPFGWRLQDQSAFVRQLSGINMTAPDKGVEVGMERDEWSAQLVYSNGPGNKGTGGGHQVTGQLIWLQSWGRLGLSTARTSSVIGGDRQAYGVFGGTRTGPVVWLAEIDLVRDAGYPEGTRTLMASLLEADWRVSQGHNLKFTAEMFDRDRRVSNDMNTRYSFVYEYSPIPFLQLRAGLRRFYGIPQNDFDNRRQTFVELHGLF